MKHDPLSQADGYAGENIQPSIAFNRDAFVLACDPKEALSAVEHIEAYRRAFNDALRLGNISKPRLNRAYDDEFGD